MADETAFRLPVLVSQVLEIAFTCLVADRTVEGMMHQKQFQDGLPGLPQLGGLGLYDHARGHRCRTGGKEPWLALKLNNTEPAASVWPQSFIKTEVRYLYAVLLCGLQYCDAVFNRNFLVIYRQFNHLCFPSFLFGCGSCEKFCWIAFKAGRQNIYGFELARIVAGPAMHAEFLDDLVRHFLFTDDRL